MTSDKGAVGEGLDERLARLRDSLLAPGEQVLAQEEGDQGQGVFLTNSRVIVAKVGITATGASNGQITGSFPLEQITGVNVRKGPLGAVIQICATGFQATVPSGPPDNVVVFTGSQRMKRCEAIAARIEKALRRPLGRVEAPEDKPSAGTVIPEPVAPAAADADSTCADEMDDAIQAALQAVETAASVAPESATSSAPSPQEEETETPAEAIEAVATEDSEPAGPRGGRQARSLADEMFAEISGAEPELPVAKPKAPRTRKRVEPEPAVEANEPEPVAAMASQSSPPEPVNERVPDVVEASEPVAQYGPNPLLPKPAARRQGTGLRSLIVVGGLMAAVLVGVAVTAPLRAPEKPAASQISPIDLTRNFQVIRKQSEAVSDYQAKVNEVVAEANQAVSRAESAVRTGNKLSVADAVRTNTVDKAWRRIDALPAPLGLAGAKEQLTSGLFICRKAFETMSGELRSTGALGAAENLARLSEGQSRIKKGIGAIEAMRADLERQSSGSKPR